MKIAGRAWDGQEFSVRSNISCKYGDVVRVASSASRRWSISFAKADPLRSELSLDEQAAAAGD